MIKIIPVKLNKKNFSSLRTKRFYTFRGTTSICASFEHTRSFPGSMNRNSLYRAHPCRSTLWDQISSADQPGDIPEVTLRAAFSRWPPISSSDFPCTLPGYGSFFQFSALYLQIVKSSTGWRINEGIAILKSLQISPYSLFQISNLKISWLSPCEYAILWDIVGGKMMIFTTNIQLGG